MIDISVAMGGGGGGGGGGGEREQGRRNFKILLLYKFTSSNVMKKATETGTVFMSLKGENNHHHHHHHVFNYYGRNTYIQIAQITISET
jgi:hypothetical protein